jgi:hypothetical protein
MVWRASAGGTACAVSVGGTESTTPAFSRFMFLPLNALGLAWNSETSIWSSEPPGRCVRTPIFASASAEGP